MSKSTKNLLLVAGIGIALFLLVRRTVAKISIGTAGVRIHKLNLNEIVLRIDLPVLNESQIPATVTGFLGQIFYGAAPVGVVQLLSPTPIPGFGQTTVQFQAVISSISALQQIYQILQNPPIDWNKFTIRGTLLVKGLPVDIDQKLLAA